MNTAAKTRFVFIGKSMLWSLLLYCVMMLLTNWDEVHNTINGKAPMAAKTTIPSTQTLPADEPAANINSHTSITTSAVTVLKIISGIKMN